MPAFSLPLLPWMWVGGGVGASFIPQRENNCPSHASPATLGLCSIWAPAVRSPQGREDPHTGGPRSWSLGDCIAEPWSLPWSTAPLCGVRWPPRGSLGCAGLMAQTLCSPPRPLPSRFPLCLGGAVCRCGSQTGREVSRSHKSEEGDLCQPEEMRLRGTVRGALAWGSLRTTRGA